MGLRIGLVASSKIQNEWSKSLEECQKTLINQELDWRASWEPFKEEAEYDLLLVSEEILAPFLQSFGDRLSWRILVLNEDRVPESLLEGKVQDVLMHPFRATEVLSKVRSFQEHQAWAELEEVNQNFSGALSRLKTDVDSAQKIAASLTPRRNEETKTYKMTSLYLAGLRSGGDYFDIFEVEPQKRTALWLSDSSSYGLTATVLSLLSRLFLRLSKRGSWEEELKILGVELSRVMGPKDHFSLFFGMLDSIQHTLTYLKAGTVKAYMGLDAQEIHGRDAPFSQSELESGIGVEWRTQTVVPGERLMFFSDGFSKALRAPFSESVSRMIRETPEKALSELSYRVRNGLEKDNPFPEQDCTAVIIETRDPNVVALGQRKTRAGL